MLHTGPLRNLIFKEVSQHHCYKVLSLSPHSSGREYRVAMGKHNLKMMEDGALFMGTASIIVHEKWNPLFIR